MRPNRLGAIMALVLLMLVSVSPAANAQTQYDDLISETRLPSLQLPLPDACSSIDYGTRWMEGFDESFGVYPITPMPGSIRQDVKDAFFASIASPTGAWAVGMQPAAFGVTSGLYAYSTVRVFFAVDATDIVSRFHDEHHGSGIHANQLRLDTVSKMTGNPPWGYAEFWVDASDDCKLKMFTGAVSATGGQREIAARLNTYNNRYAVQNNEFLFSTFDVEYPVGYEGESVPNTYTPPTPTYVAMGDSFSSGEGNEPFEDGTDTSANKCHRSETAYPYLLSNDATLDIGPVDFVACSGATTASILNGHPGGGNWNEGAQIDALSADTEVVTITIGGNDVGFKEFAEACLHPVGDLFLNAICDEFTTIYADTMAATTITLPSSLESVFAALLVEAPNAQIYVGGYPVIAPYKNINDPFDNECGGLYDDFPNTWGDARAAYNVVMSLNDVIEEAVDAVNIQYSSTRLHYVDVENGSFFGHDMCSDDRYFNGIDVFNPEYSVHPNVEGHVAYYGDFKEYIN